MSVIRVTVCVATYRRPAGLDRLLASLEAVDTTTADAEPVEMRVIVADNDVRRTAEPIVERHRDRLPDLVYAVEPVKGYPHVLNRLVHIALDGDDLPDFLAFVDDDEWVDPSWRRAFLSCARDSGCVLTGPVQTHLGMDVPHWIRDGGFFQRPSHPTGTEVRFAGSGNLLVPIAVLESVGGERAFERALGLGSDLLGSDALFSVLVRGQGHRIQWCAEALVCEDVDGGRASARWLVRRAFDSGFSFSRVVRLTMSSRVELAHRVASATGHLAAGVLQIVPGLLRGRAALVHALRRCALGVGALAGLVYPMPSSSEAARRHVS